jgi:hypothetical protein
VDRSQNRCTAIRGRFDNRPSVLCGQLESALLCQKNPVAQMNDAERKMMISAKVNRIRSVILVIFIDYDPFELCGRLYP